MRLFVPVSYVKRQSKYLPHQGKRERIRRLRRMANGSRGRNPQDEWIPALEAQNRLLELIK